MLGNIMNGNRMSDTRGFTIIELLVVIAIIGILSAVILASLANAREKARVATAMATAKAMHQAAQVCLSELVPVCLPGQTTAGCGASAAADLIDGGQAFICTTQPSRYVALPTGWVWCDSAAAGTCNPTTSSQQTGVSYSIRAKRPAGGEIITCTDNGTNQTTCSCAGTLCPTI